MKNKVMLSKIAIHKSSEWKLEKEWRLFCSNNRPNFFHEAHSFINKNSVAIYLGRKISSINEKFLKTLLEKRGLSAIKWNLINRKFIS